MASQDSPAISLFVIEGTSMRALQTNLLIVQVSASGQESPGVPPAGSVRPGAGA